jgi:hypothetical protein
VVAEGVFSCAWTGRRPKQEKTTIMKHVANVLGHGGKTPFFEKPLKLPAARSYWTSISDLLGNTQGGNSIFRPQNKLAECDLGAIGLPSQ